MTTEDPAPTATLRGHPVPLGLYIDGTWSMRQRVFEVLNPSDGSSVASLPDAEPDDAVRALDAASKAQRDWAGWAPRARADLFHTAHRLMLERAGAFADIITIESGKPRSEAEGEFALSAAFFGWYAEQIAHLHGSYAHGSPGGYRVITTHQPVGPCLLITPWNFPLLMSARKAGAALAAGCTVVMKTAKETPLTGAYFVKSLHDAGFPPGVVNLIHTANSAPISRVLLDDPRLRKISFTGSTGVGAELLVGAARNIVNASMELGGDGPFIVLDDADVDLAVEQALVCKFRNAGQACVAANRIILHEAISGEFTDKFIAGSKALLVGDGFQPGVEVGPIISEAQRARVIDLVEAFRQLGAEVLTGGSSIEGDGFFYEPTVLNVGSRDNDLCREELFAPVATLYTVGSAAEAIKFANDTKYGLASYLFTRDLSRAITLSEAMDFGMVGINRGIMADPAAAFGGVKASGLGREGGQDGIYEFLEPKYLALTIDEQKAYQ